MRQSKKGGRSSLVHSTVVVEYEIYCTPYGSSTGFVSTIILSGRRRRASGKQTSHTSSWPFNPWTGSQADPCSVVCYREHPGGESGHRHMAQCHYDELMMTGVFELLMPPPGNRWWIRNSTPHPCNLNLHHPFTPERYSYSVFHSSTPQASPLSFLFLFFSPRPQHIFGTRSATFIWFSLKDSRSLACCFLSSFKTLSTNPPILSTSQLSKLQSQQKKQVSANNSTHSFNPSEISDLVHSFNRNTL